MLALESHRWAELEHAYGPASDIPSLLRELESYPASNDGEAEPWFSLWSSLCHQGDIYSASFAAVPHIIRLLAANTIAADLSFFQLPTCVEIARAQADLPIPADLQEAYVAALSQFPAIVAAAAAGPWDANKLSCILAAIAAAKGFPTVAEAVLELDPDTAPDFMEWLSEQ